MAEEKVIELGVHSPTVASVIARLNRFEDDIEHITVVVSWKENGVGVFSNCMPFAEMAGHKIMFEKHVRDEMDDD